MELLIITPLKTLYNGEADMVEVPGKKGRFTILHNHAPIISLLEKGNIIYRHGNEEKQISIEWGLVEALDNKITICIEKNDK